MKEHQAELATLEALDNGKLYTEAYNDDVQEASDLFEYNAGWTDKYYGENNPVEGNFLSVTTRDPIGVCRQIVPFNFPIQMAALKLSPALAMGNTILLKPSKYDIIFSDAPDLAEAIERSFYGLFTHKGEKCSAPTCLLVQRDVYNEVVKKLRSMQMTIRVVTHSILKKRQLLLRTIPFMA